MKNFSLLSAMLILCALITFAQGPHNVIFFSEEGETFTVYINGVQQNAEPATNVRIDDLRGTAYNLRVLFEHAVPGEFTKSMPLPEGSTEMTFALRKNKKGAWVARFVSEAPFPAKSSPGLATRPQQQKEARPAPSGNQNQEIITTTTVTSDDSEFSEGMDVSVKIGDQNFGMNVKIDDPTATRQTTTVTTQTITTQTGTIEHEAADIVEIDDTGGCKNPMNKADFATAKESIASKSFEDSKLKIAKQITRGNCLSAMQVKQIMELFSFEESRLDFAKFAYDFTFDKQNYYQVNDAFQFEMTIEELDEYLEK